MTASERRRCTPVHGGLFGHRGHVAATRERFDVQAFVYSDLEAVRHMVLGQYLDQFGDVTGGLRWTTRS
jgi:hypothetical protein